MLPPAAIRLLRLVVPVRLVEPIAGDLEERWRLDIARSPIRYNMAIEPPALSGVTLQGARRRGSEPVRPGAQTWSRCALKC
jgi:hypothetical protein